MKILTIDTTNKNITIILQEDSTIIDSLIIENTTKQAEELVIDIEKILNNNRIWYENIDAFSVVNGPGSFTGLKVSMAIIKAIKSVFPNIPIITNNIFEIISYNEDFDFVILSADLNGQYICDKNHKMEYMRNDKIALLLNEENLKSKKIITNKKNLMDYFKLENYIIEYKNTSVKNIVSLNNYKFENNSFDYSIVPLYMREPQINKK